MKIFSKNTITNNRQFVGCHVLLRERMFIRFSTKDSHYFGRFLRSATIPRDYCSCTLRFSCLNVYFVLSRKHFAPTNEFACNGSICNNYEINAKPTTYQIKYGGITILMIENHLCITKM